MQWASGHGVGALAWALGLVAAGTDAVYARVIDGVCDAVVKAAEIKCTHSQWRFLILWQRVDFVGRVLRRARDEGEGRGSLACRAED